MSRIFFFPRKIISPLVSIQTWQQQFFFFLLLLTLLQRYPEFLKGINVNWKNSLWLNHILMIQTTGWRKAIHLYEVPTCVYQHKGHQECVNVYLQIPVLLPTTYISDVQWHPLHLYQNVYNLFKKEFLAQCKRLAEMKKCYCGKLILLGLRIDCVWAATSGLNFLTQPQELPKSLSPVNMPFYFKGKEGKKFLFFFLVNFDFNRDFCCHGHPSEGGPSRLTRRNVERFLLMSSEGILMPMQVL